MTSEHRLEQYRICIDLSVTSADALFTRVTEVAYLGYSKFSGWDAFYDMLRSRLESSNILIEIPNRDLSALPEEDRATWLIYLRELNDEFAMKLQVLGSDL